MSQYSSSRRKRRAYDRGDNDDDDAFADIQRRILPLSYNSLFDSEGDSDEISSRSSREGGAGGGTKLPVVKKPRIRPPAAPRAPHAPQLDGASDNEEAVQSAEMHRAAVHAAANARDSMEQNMANASFRMSGGGSGGGDAACSPDGEWTKGPFLHLDLLQLDREDMARWPELHQRHRQCPLCAIDQTETEQEAFPELLDMHKSAQDAIARMDPVRWMTFMSNIYEKSVRPYLHELNKPPMLRTMIYEHYDEHAPSVAWTNEAFARVTRQVMSTMERHQLFEHNTQTREKRVVSTTLLMMLKMEKDRRPILKAIGESRAAASALKQK